MGILLVLLALVCFCSVLGDPNEREARLLWEEFFEWKSSTYPEWATSEGISAYDGDVEDFSLAGTERKQKKVQEFLER